MGVSKVSTYCMDADADADLPMQYADDAALLIYSLLRFIPLDDSIRYGTIILTRFII